MATTTSVSDDDITDQPKAPDSTGQAEKSVDALVGDAPTVPHLVETVPNEVGKPRTENLRAQPASGMGPTPPGNGYRPRAPFIRSRYQPRPRDTFANGYTRDDLETTETQAVSGVLESMPEGHGFLRPQFTPSDKDIYISLSQIRRFLLRPGDIVSGLARPPKETERYLGLLKVEKVNDTPSEDLGTRPKYDDLTPLYPNQHLKIETGKFPLGPRVIDLIAPIGFGQRALIVSPPKAGKTTVLKEIADAVAKNFPNVQLMAVLVGERPEEVTDIARSVKGEVIASNFDESAEQQVRAAEIALERAKRLVEQGKGVVMLLDSITRLARAYNLSVPPSGRTLSGGFDPAALYPPKRYFGAARNCEEGGSLTIIGTALVDTGSRMDDLIYEEFKGTGNMELHLDRRLAEKRVYPAINVERSGTRAEEKLFPEEVYKKIITMRRMLSVLSDEERTELLLERLSKTEDNDTFLSTLKPTT